MLFDKETGNLFTTDQVGNNRAHVTDSFWMQFASLNNPYIFADPMDVYLSSLQIAMERVNSLGTVKRILTGHNDVVLDGQGSYLNNLMTATQKIVDEGRGMHNADAAHHGSSARDHPHRCSRRPLEGHQLGRYQRRHDEFPL